MSTLILQRLPERGNGTPGFLTGIGLMFATVERPWLQNQHNVSCIPGGKYPITLIRNHPHFGKCLAIGNVPDRSGIFMHVANWPHELRGCVAPGLDHDPTSEELTVQSSGIALARIFNILNDLPEPLFLDVRLCPRG